MAELFKRALLIRRFEERLLALFAQGKLNGTVHTCLGQEFSALAVAAAAGADDVVFSNHRGHGHYLAFHDNPAGLLAEIMGRASGVCQGLGGSQHLQDRNFFSNGVLGGMSPVAVGSAWARKLQGRAGVSIVFHGDGALGEGVVYEAMNIAAAWGLPVLWVIERNGYAQSTDCRQTTAGSLAGRAAGFGLASFAGDTWNVENLLSVSRAAFGHVREKSLPAVLEIGTYRLAAHSKGDDNRAPQELDEFRAKDPLNRFIRENPGLAQTWDHAVAARLDRAQAEAEQAPVCAFRPVWRPWKRHEPLQWRSRDSNDEGGGERYSSLLYQTLGDQFSTDARTLMIGEDIEGAYGGAFKVTRDLSQLHPGRVRNTPISEAALTGVGTGAAIEGMRPLVEIMFGDFLTLTFDQLLQHACKFSTMFAGKVQVPLIVRTPMGGRRGYGPTHSQSIEGHFLGIPELDVVALNARLHPRRIYGPLWARAARPALVVENKILYTRPLRTSAPAGFVCHESDEDIPAVRLSPASGQPQVTVICYGGMLEEAEAALVLAFQEEEIMAELICPAQLVPLNPAPMAESVARTGRVVVVEEGKTFAAFGSEVLAELAGAGMAFRCRRLGYDHYIPSSYQAEAALLPDARMIVRAMKELLHD